jgi:prepilin-type processing-associated H-X9-DG protein
MHTRRHGRPGISLIEVVVVLAMLAILAGVMLWWVSEVREVRVPSIQCQNNMRQLALGTINCADTNAGRLPPLVGPYPKAMSDGTLFFHILPYMEQNPLYQAAVDEKGNHSVWNAGTFGKEVQTYVCPSDKSRPENGLYKGWLATSSYAGNGLVFGDSKSKSLNGTNRFPASIADGTSQTIFFTERFQICNQVPCAWGYPGDYYWAPVFAFYSEGKFQTAPTQAECDPTLAQGPHAGGINVALGDGSVRLVATTISPQTWWHACTPAAGDVLGIDW